MYLSVLLLVFPGLMQGWDLIIMSSSIFPLVKCIPHCGSCSVLPLALPRHQAAVHHCVWLFGNWMQGETELSCFSWNYFCCVALLTILLPWLRWRRLSDQNKLWSNCAVQPLSKINLFSDPDYFMGLGFFVIFLMENVSEVIWHSIGASEWDFIACVTPS